MAIEEGKAAPAFTLPDANGKTVSLKDFAGKNVILYFYPEGRHARLHEGSVRLPRRLEDPAEARRRRARRLRRQRRRRTRSSPPSTSCRSRCSPMPTAKVMEKYGAYGEKMMYGKKTIGVIRSTVWIGPDGKVKKHWARVANAEQHPAKVLEALRGG